MWKAIGQVLPSAEIWVFVIGQGREMLWRSIIHYHQLFYSKVVEILEEI
ncbi:unnamed protein product [Camellia sinensis]